MTQPRFSLVIPALNASSSLEMVLRCLEAQGYPFDRFECIIVDDGSTDATPDLLQSYRAPFPLLTISHTRNLGRAAARNAGWHRAQGEIVVFLDADTLPAPNWLCDYDRAFSLDYDVISGGRYCVESNPNSEDFRQRLCEICESQPDDLLRKNIDTQFAKLHDKSAIGAYISALSKQFELELRNVCSEFPKNVLCGYSFITSNVAVRRNVLERTNGFDEFLRRGEDTDLGIRIWELGSRFGYADGAAAYHQCHADDADRDFTYGEYLAFFYRNPYRLVLLLYFWLREYVSLQDGAVPLVSDLVQLVKKSAECTDGDLVEEYCTRYKFVAPVNCQVTKDELVQSYAETTGISEQSLHAYLDKAVADGLYVRRCSGKTLFDFHTTSNWLRYRTSFQEQWITVTSYSRLRKTSCARTRDRSVYAVCEYHGRYEVCIDRVDDAACRVEALANIPLPITETAQYDVRIIGCYPPDLLDHADPHLRMIDRYDLQFGAGEVRVGYDFVCKVMEMTSPREDYAGDLAFRYGALSWSSKWHPKLQSILLKTGCEDQKTDEQRARAIYLWILDNTFYSSTPFQDANILDMGCGTCLDQTRLFVNLCRCAGIPARERCGALLQRSNAGLGASVFETVTLAASPFAHSWAEFHIASRGWIPVEFIGQSYGKRILRPSNVTDYALRRQLLEDTDLYDDYYFGVLDPYRIHVASEVCVKSMHPVLSKGKMTSSSRRHLAAINHHLTCELVHYSERRKERLCA